MKSISMIPMQAISKDSGMVVGKVVGMCFMGSDDAVEHSVLLQELILEDTPVSYTHLTLPTTPYV